VHSHNLKGETVFLEAFWVCKIVWPKVEEFIYLELKLISAYIPQKSMTVIFALVEKMEEFYTVWMWPLFHIVKGGFKSDTSISRSISPRAQTLSRLRLEMDRYQKSKNRKISYGKQHFLWMYTWWKIKSSLPWIFKWRYALLRKLFSLI